MHMATLLRRWTVDEVLAIPDDGKRREVIDGELFVSPAPTLVHQRVLSILHYRIREYLLAHPAGEILTSPADIVFDRETLVQPDIFVAPLVNGRRPSSWKDIRHLLLAIEVLSPSTARLDRVRKRERYQRAGVPEYWIVDHDARAIERWRPEDERPEILAERIEWIPAVDVPPAEGLVIALADFFEEAVGDLE